MTVPPNSRATASARVDFPLAVGPPRTTARDMGVPRRSPLSRAPGHAGYSPPLAGGGRGRGRGLHARARGESIRFADLQCVGESCAPAGAIPLPLPPPARGGESLLDASEDVCPVLPAARARDHKRVTRCGAPPTG